MNDSLDLAVLEDIPDEEEWDALVDAADAPFLYRAGPLRAYVRSPLQRGTQARFAMFRRTMKKELAAALPVFILPAADPLGILERVVPGYSSYGRPLTLSHVWHWYDTRVPRRTSIGELGEPLAGALHGIGRSAGAQITGLVNVAADDPVLTALCEYDFAIARIDRRLRADLTAWSDADDWLRSLDRPVRQDLRRQLRRARANGCEIRYGKPTPSSADAAARLCAATGAKHGNPGWYPTSEMARLIHAWREHVALTTITRDGTTLAASVALVDGTVFHNWAAGTMPYSALGFSPYALFLYKSIREAIARGCTTLEGGRRNEEWKRRRGLEPVDLYGAFARVGR
jgi:predicted N-acyltransferase